MNIKNTLTLNYRSLFILIFVSLLAFVFVFLVAKPTHAATHNVCASGCSFTSIQSAITAASAGDTILVSPGTYTGAITLNKGITLQASTFNQSDPRSNTVILSGGSSSTNVVTIPAGVSGNPTVRGFVIKTGDSGVKVNSISTIEYNYFQTTVDMAEYEVGSGGVNRGNYYVGAGDDCIDLDDQNKDILVEGNTCVDPNDDGLEMRFQDGTSPTTKITVTVRNNRFESANGDGFQFIDYNTDTNRRVILEKNLFLNNAKAGVGFLCCTLTSNNLSAHPMREEARIINNTFVGNANGITGGGNALVVNNIFLNTTGIALKGVTGSSYVSNNLLFNNTTNTSGTDSQNSILGNPLLSTTYVPQSGSAAIDTGVSSLTWNSLFETISFSIPSSQYSGNGPDVGWKETGLVGASPTPSPSPTPQPSNTPAPTPTSTPSGDQTVSLIVPAVSDDAEENTSTGTVNLTSTDLEFSTDGSANQIVGIRFDSAAIPQGATIKSAYIEFTAKEAHSETTSITIYGNDTDNTPTFSTSTNNISSRAKTSASVAWSNIPAWTIGSTYKTPDLKSIIQEVVNRPGWVNGNPLAFIITGSGHRTAFSFDGNNASAPFLSITYSTSPSTTPAPTTCPVIPTDKGVATGAVNIPTTGEYRVWSRIQVQGDSANSYYLQVDNNCGVVVGNSTGMAQNSWIWVDYTDGNPSSKLNMNLTAGTHTIKAYGRETNLKLDEIIFVADLNCIPVNTGGNCLQIPSSTPTPTTSPTSPPSNTPSPTPTQTPSPTPTRTPAPTPSPTPLPTPSPSPTPAPDNDAPTAPSNLHTTSVSPTQVNLAWNASVDNVSVKGYKVFRNNIQIATVTTTSFGDATVAPQTNYSYHTVAFDAANNTSQSSNTLAVTTPAIVPQVGNISGTISSSTGGSVAYAKVITIVNGSKRTYRADSQGKYTIPNLPASTYSVTYSAKGYVSQKLNITVLNGQNIVQDVTLSKIVRR